MNPIALKIAFCAVQVAGVAVMVLLACYFVLKALDAVVKVFGLYSIVLDYLRHRKAFKLFMASPEGKRFRHGQRFTDEDTPEAARKRLARGDDVTS